MAHQDVNGTLRSAIGYYIGDICYVLEDGFYDNWWGNGYPKVIDPTRGCFDDGLFEDVEGCGYGFAVCGTGIGDGCYHDTHDTHEFCVDAGVIGMIPVEFLKIHGKPECFLDDGTVDVHTLNYYGAFIPVSEETEAEFDAEYLGEGWGLSTHYTISIGRETIEIYTDEREDPNYEDDEDYYDEDEDEDEEDDEEDEDE